MLDITSVGKLSQWIAIINANKVCRYSPFEKMLNYNLLLEDLLNHPDTTALEEAIANQFSPAVIREKLRFTHKYERLPLPFFKLSTNDNVYVELLAEICSEQSAERKYT